MTTFTDEKEIVEYVGAAWIAKRLGISQQTVSQAGQRALNENYRGDMLKPDASLEGRPIWRIENAESYINSKKEIDKND